MKFSDNNLRELRYLTDTLRGQATISRIFDLHFGKVVKTALKVRKNDTFQNVRLYIYLYICDWVCNIWMATCQDCVSGLHMVRLSTWFFEVTFFVRYESTASQHSLGRQQTETDRDAIEQRLAFTCEKWTVGNPLLNPLKSDIHIFEHYSRFALCKMVDDMLRMRMR